MRDPRRLCGGDVNARPDHLLVMELTGGGAFELPSRRAAARGGAVARGARAVARDVPAHGRCRARGRAATVRPRATRASSRWRRCFRPARRRRRRRRRRRPHLKQRRHCRHRPLLGFHLHRQRFRRRRCAAAAAGRRRRRRHPRRRRRRPSCSASTSAVGDSARHATAAVSPEPDADSALLRQLFECARLAPSYLYKFEQQQFDLESLAMLEIAQITAPPLSLDHRAASVLHDALKPCALLLELGLGDLALGAFVRASIESDRAARGDRRTSTRTRR